VKAASMFLLLETSFLMAKGSGAFLIDILLFSKNGNPVGIFLDDTDC
jgi:hypothetical protein